MIFFTEIQEKKKIQRYTSQKDFVILRDFKNSAILQYSKMVNYIKRSYYTVVDKKMCFECTLLSNKFKKQFTFILRKRKQQYFDQDYFCCNNLKMSQTTKKQVLMSDVQVALNI
jgi:hypothetical protein